MSAVNALIIQAHPVTDPWGAAVQSAVMAELEAAGLPCRVHDLYRMGFQPALSDADFQAWARGEQPGALQPLQADVVWADLLVLIYPTRFGGTPAMLKGYIDRVFAMGFAYGVREGKMGAFLTGKRALLFPTTTDPTDLELVAELGPVMGGATLAFCGVTILAQEDLIGRDAAQLELVRERVRSALSSGNRLRG